MDRIVIRTQEDKDAICDWVIAFLEKLPDEKVPFVPPFDSGELVVESDQAVLQFKCLGEGGVSFRTLATYNREMSVFGFKYNYSTQQVTDKWFNPKLLDVPKAIKKEEEWQYCQRLAMIWFSVMLLATYYRPEFDSRKQIVGEKAKPRKKGKKSKATTKMLYVRNYVVGADMLDKLPHEVKHRKGPDHEFGVRGHYRHYKSGKVVWIQPYTRCKGRGEGRDRTYIAKVKEGKEWA